MAEIFNKKKLDNLLGNLKSEKEKVGETELPEIPMSRPGKESLDDTKEKENSIHKDPIERELDNLYKIYLSNIEIGKNSYGENTKEFVEDKLDKDKWYEEEKSKIFEKYEKERKPLRWNEKEKIEEKKNEKFTPWEELEEKSAEIKSMNEKDLRSEIKEQIEIEEVKKEYEKLPEEDKQKIGWGIKTIGFKAEQKKNDFFAGTFNLILKKLPEDKRAYRFCKELRDSFVRDSGKAYETAKNIKSGEEKHRLKNTSLVFGNIIRYGRVLTDFTGLSLASPMRYVMMGGMAFTRMSEAAKETHLKNEEVIDKTRIQDANRAAEEAWGIYEKAKEKNEDVSAENLEKIYKREIPKDILKRLENESTGNNFVQKILSKIISNQMFQLEKSILEIENNKEIYPFQKEQEIEKLIKKQENKLIDYDRIVTQLGIVDELGMAGRYAQTAGKVVVGAMTIETLYLSVDKLIHIMSNMLSEHSDSLIDITNSVENNKTVGNGMLDTDTTEAKDSIITQTINQNDSSGTKISPEIKDGTVPEEIKTKIPIETPKESTESDEIKNKILEQFKTNEATVHKGEGIEHSFIRQIENNPELAKELGFEGDINDTKALHEFAGKEAHIIARETGYVDGSGREIRIAEADKVAYEINLDNEGRITIDEKNIVDGKIETIETHHEGDKFEEEIEKHEKIYKNPETEEEISLEKDEKDIEIEKKPTFIDKPTLIKGTDGKMYNEEEWIKSPKNLYNISLEDLSKVNENHYNAINKLTAEGSIEHIKDIIENGVAEKIIGSKPESISRVPLYDYINKLHEITKLKPRGSTWFRQAETNNQYIQRALEKAASLGKLEEVKLNNLEKMLQNDTVEKAAEILSNKTNEINLPKSEVFPLADSLKGTFLYDASGNITEFSSKGMIKGFIGDPLFKEGFRKEIMEYCTENKKNSSFEMSKLRSSEQGLYLNLASYDSISKNPDYAKETEFLKKIILKEIKYLSKYGDIVNFDKIPEEFRKLEQK